MRRALAAAGLALALAGCASTPAPSTPARWTGADPTAIVRQAGAVVDGSLNSPGGLDVYGDRLTDGQFPGYPGGGGITVFASPDLATFNYTRDVFDADAANTPVIEIPSELVRIQVYAGDVTCGIALARKVAARTGGTVELPKGAYCQTHGINL